MTLRELRVVLDAVPAEYLDLEMVTTCNIAIDRGGRYVGYIDLAGGGWVELQSRCPGCGGSFIYYPEREPVILDGDVYWHKGCWPGVGGSNREAPPSVHEKISGKTSRWGMWG